MKPLSPLWTDPNSLVALTPETVQEGIQRRDALPGMYRGTERWRMAVFVVGGAVMAAVWSAVLGTSVWGLVERNAQGDAWMVWTTAMTAFSWVSRVILLIRAFANRFFQAYLTLHPIFKPSRTPSMMVFTLYITHLTVSLISLVMTGYVRTVTSSPAPWASLAFFALESLSLVASIILIIATLGMPLVDPEITDRLGADVQREDKVTLYDWITFAWVNPLIQLGYKQTLKDDDVPKLSITMRSEQVFASLLAISEPRQDAKGNTIPPPSLLRRLITLNAVDLVMDASLTFVSVLCNYASPFLLKKILDSLSEPTPQTKARAYIYASLALLASVGKAEADLLHLWHGRRGSVRVKNQLVAIIYEKALKRKDFSGVVGLGEKPEKAEGKSKREAGKGKKSKKEKKEEKKVPEKNVADTGRVVSLMASDTGRGMFFRHFLRFPLMKRS